MRALALAAVLAGACAGVPRGAPRVRVVTYNIHHGADADDHVDVARLAGAIAELRADVVCLQEVDKGVRRSGGQDLPAELARRLGMFVVFGKNIDYQGGDYGNAILSRWPVLESDNLHYRMLRPDEQRGLLIARLDAPFGPLAVGCTHIDYRPDDAERVANGDEILAAAERLDVLGGDFNDVPVSRVHGALAKAFVDCWQAVGVGDGATYPVAEPKKRIDWLLVRRGGAWSPVAASVPASAASDHRPLVVDLQRDAP